jgi:hypothetical protein
VIQRIQGAGGRAHWNGADPGRPPAPALFTGPPMPADSVVVLTALQQRFPQLLSTEMLAARLVPAAERAAAGPEVFAELEDPRRGELTALLAERPDTWPALTRDSLARFLQVSRNILQTGTLTPAVTAPEPPPPPAGPNGAGTAPPP